MRELVAKVMNANLIVTQRVAGFFRISKHCENACSRIESCPQTDETVEKLGESGEVRVGTALVESSLLLV